MMTWTKQDEGSGPIWICEMYKIVRYESSFQDRLGMHYRAYYIRKPDKYWGYHVDPHTPFYLSLDEAQYACEQHMTKHPQIAAKRLAQEVLSL